MLFNQAKGALHQRAAFVVRKLAERNTGYPEMVFFIRVAPRAAEGTLAGEFRHRQVRIGVSANYNPSVKGTFCPRGLTWD